MFKVSKTMCLKVRFYSVSLNMRDTEKKAKNTRHLRALKCFVTGYC